MTDYENLLLDFYEEKSVNLADQILNDSFAYSPKNSRNVLSPSALKTIYQSEEWVYILVDRIASKISSQWLRVMREEVIEGKKVANPDEAHPVQAMLENPNEDQDYHTFMYNVVSDECLGGNAIIWRARRSNQLIQLPFDLTTPELQQDGTIKSYMVIPSDEIGVKAIRFSPDEICHIKRPNPSSRIWGLSPFIPGLKSLMFQRFTSEYLNNFYIRGAQPGLVLEMTDGVNEERAKRFLETLENSHRGRMNQRKPMILPRGVTAQPITHSLADQQLIEYVRNNRETIINLLQVPKHELSIAESGSLGSEEYKMALKNFWNGPLRSIMRRIAGSLTRFFAAELGENAYLEFDISDVDVLQEDANQKAELAERLLATHTLNEVRGTVYNLDPVPNGDTVRGNAPTGLGQLQQEPRPALTTDQTMGIIHDVEKGLVSREAAMEILHTIHGIPLESVERILPKIQDNLDTLETKSKNFTLFRKSVGTWFEESDDKIVKASNKAEPLMMKRAVDLMGAMAVAAAEVLLDYEKSVADYETKELPGKRELRKRIRRSLLDLQDQYLEGLTDDLESVVETGYDTALALSFGQDDRDRLEAIRERGKSGRRAILEERGLETFAYMTDSRTEEIMSIIEAGLEENRSIRQITRDINERFTDEDLTLSRANTIARTETLTAVSVGQLAAIKDAEKVLGPMLKMWVNAGDERVRGNPSGKYANSKADHWVLQGEVVKSNEPFSNGLMLPRDLRGKAHDVINCRCRVVAVAAEDAQAIGFGDLDQENTGA